MSKETLTTLTETEALSLTETKLEERILRYFQNKEIAKERTEENKLIFEEIEELFEHSGKTQIAVQLPNGEFAVLAPRTYIKDILDKDSLALELQIAKDELKTPFDFSMLTKQGKLTPDMISRHTTTETGLKMRLSKKKNKPKEKKGE